MLPASAAPAYKGSQQNNQVDNECLVVVCHMSIVAHIAGLLTGDYPESFALAEARVFEMDFVLAGMATEIDRFVPEQPY